MNAMLLDPRTQPLKGFVSLQVPGRKGLETIDSFDPLGFRRNTGTRRAGDINPALPVHAPNEIRLDKNRLLANH